MKTTANILAWILAVLLAVVFLFAGGVKLLGSRAMVQEFAQIGAGQWFRYVTGVLEVSGAIGILIPKYRFWAALQLAAVMAGATAVKHLGFTYRASGPAHCSIAGIIASLRVVAQTAK